MRTRLEVISSETGMVDGVADLDAIAEKADRMYDQAWPGFVHARRTPLAHGEWTELRFPCGLVCTTNSSPIEAELQYNEIFERKEYLRSGISLGARDTIIDVGANIGMFSLYLLTTLENPTFYAIEPVPATFEALRKNIERFPNASVGLRNIALGAWPESIVDIVVFPRMTGNSTAYSETKALQKAALSSLFTEAELAVIYAQESIRVPSTTLSSLIEKNSIETINLLKIDTEGSELDILRGIESRHWDQILQCGIEVHNEPDQLRHVVEILAAHGMRPHIDEATRDAFGTVVLTARRP